MHTKRVFLNILFLLCYSYVLASDEHSLIKKLSNDPYWHILLHFKDGKSEIDDSSFFLASDGYKSPKSELNATIEHIKAKDMDMLCRYPARIAWIKEKIPKLFTTYKFTSCEKLEKLFKNNPPNHMSLIFPTAHVNSPASMFGHTFLRVDSNISTPLISQAINYAAQTGENNGILFAYYGLTGGYRGYYSVLPYYKKIKEYTHMEQRDMWEYSLNLNHKEIRRLLYHLYELKNRYTDYYFFTKNCSYNLLWLLESARGDASLVEDFSYKAIPIDTIRKVKEHDFIDGVHFRPSKRKKMQTIVKNIKDISLTKNFIENYDLSLLDKLNELQKIYTLDLAIAYLKHQRSHHKLVKKNYIKTLMRLLKSRSSLAKIPPYKIKKPINPLLGHKSAKVTFYGGADEMFGFSIKPAFTDIYDLENGFVQGAYIDFFALDIQKRKNESVKINKFDFVSISSLSKRDIFFKPYSWSVNIGLQRVHDKKLYFRLGGGGGVSYGTKSSLFYLLVKPSLYLSGDSKFSIGSKIGFIKNYQRFKVGSSFQKRFFSDSIIERSIEGFITCKLSTNTALNLKLQEDKIAKKHKTNTVLALFYYF